MEGVLQQTIQKCVLINNIKEFEVYKRSYSISLEIHKISRNFPDDERYALTSQIRRASKSICANLGEGYAKQNYSIAEFKRFVLMAIGSCNEVIIWSDYCMDLGYINNETWNKWNLEYQQILKMLNSLRLKIGS